MKSFARNLVIGFAGIILIGFLVVYFLFNTLIDNHIRAEAEQTLSAFALNFTDAAPLFILAEQSDLLHDGEMGVILPTQQLIESQPVEQSLLNFHIVYSS